MHQLDTKVNDELRKSLIDNPPNTDYLEMREYDLRLASIEEIREITRERVLAACKEEEMRATIPCYQALRLGDVVLRRQFNVDKSLGMKLYTKWDGPYLLVRVAKPGVSRDL